jgi:tetratricopeptide (TPR) repeat protein
VAPQSYQFFLLMAQDAESRNFDDEAIKDYEQALRLAGSHEPVGVHYALGRLYAKSGKAAEATAEFQKELKFNPYDSLSLWRLGEVLSRSDPQQARPYLERAVELNPQLPQAALAYGRVLPQLGETRKAILEFQRVVRLAPEEHTVYYHLFKAHRQLGQHEEARKELTVFQEMARKRSEGIQEAARRLMDLDRAGQAVAPEPEPGFSPQREPVHQ